MGIILLTSVLVVLALIALFFMRGGAQEPVTHTGVLPASARLSPGERAEQLIAALDMEIVRRDPDEGDGPGFVANSRSGNNRQRVYVRAFDLPPGERVRAPDVVAAIDLAKSEGFNKTLLVSSNGFSDEALLAADDSVAELIDEASLDGIVRKGPLR